MVRLKQTTAHKSEDQFVSRDMKQRLTAQTPQTAYICLYILDIICNDFQIVLFETKALVVVVMTRSVW